ncbi:MAG: NAD(P)/FAD-dependent oxidoreductase [Carnobacterium sp.]|uniref:dihydrolipoyl dehydrogenase family protein n=1 Tax=Carnobacterium sp. TaxID=48221 RepID=UPI002FC91B3C
MEKAFDVIVIGSGVGGTAIANGLAATGEKVAVVENDLWGGTCPNRGCDPKKVLVSAVEAKDAVTQLAGKGFSVTPQVNWPELMEFKETFTKPVPKTSQESLQSAGIETFTGSAQFTDEKTLQVNEDILTAERFVIAAGAKPSILPIEGKEHFLTSNDFLSLPEMPETITFVGGGYIAFELAAIANAAGANVHLVHHNGRPLKAFDEEYVKEIVHQLETKGVTFHFNIDINKIEKKADSFILIDGKKFHLTSDLVFCSTGRVPNIDELKLENAGVAFDKKGITVNEYLQTSNAAIFACGDVLSKTQPKLTPVSTFEGSYLVHYLTGEATEKIAYPSIPTTIFSSPKLAQTGMTAAQASEQEEDYDVSDIDATSWFSYHRVNEPVSKIKIITERKTGLLVGATCINKRADDLINFFSLLIDQKTPAEDVAQLILAYPTIASDLTSIYA